MGFCLTLTWLELIGLVSHFLGSNRADDSNTDSRKLQKGCNIGNDDSVTVFAAENTLTWGRFLPLIFGVTQEGLELKFSQLTNSGNSNWKKSTTCTWKYHANFTMCLRGSLGHSWFVLLFVDIVLKTGASGMIAYRLLTKDLKWQWLQTSSRLVYKNSKPDFIISTHRPLM